MRKTTHSSDEPNITWTSSDNNIAYVDNNGYVMTVNKGDCTIKATSEDGGFEAICKLTVKPLPVVGIKFSDYSYRVEIGGEKQLSVLFTPANAGNKKIKWSSSNPISVSIDENGKVKGNTSGRSTITATSEDGGHTATCVVQVVEIDWLMTVTFPSASVAIINGYYTGSIYCSITNNSSNTIKLTNMRVVDTNTFWTVAETSDEALLGNLAPGQTVTLGGRFNSVYEPAFRWSFEYNGKTYFTYDKYGDRSVLSEEVTSKGRAETLVPLSKK